MENILRMKTRNQSEHRCFKSRLVINSLIQCNEKLLFDAYLPFQLIVCYYFVWLGKGLKPWLWWFRLEAFNNNVHDGG